MKKEIEQLLNKYFESKSYKIRSLYLDKNILESNIIDEVIVIKIRAYK